MRRITRQTSGAGIALLLALAVAGCGGRATQAASPPRDGDAASLEIRVELSRVELPPGESVQISVAVTNPTARPVRIQFNSGCMIVYAVKDAGGKLVAPTHYACTANTPTLEIAPYATVTQPFTWDGTDGAPGGVLPPGDYFVVGALGSEAAVPPSEPVAIRLLSK